MLIYEYYISKPIFCCLRFLGSGKIFLGLALFFLCLPKVHCQENDSSDIARTDTSSQSAYTKRLQNIFAEGYTQSKQELEAKRTEGIQRIILGQIKGSVQQAKKYLADGIDSVRIEKNLTLIESQKDIVERGVFEEEGILQSDRNLAVSRAILSQLIEQTTGFKNKIDTKSKELFQLSYQIDSLTTTKEIYSLPADSALAVTALNKFLLVAKEVEPTINALNSTLKTLDKLQSRTDEVLLALETSILETEKRRESLNLKIFSTEVFEYADLNLSSLPFSEVLQTSHQKELLALNLYFQIYKGRIFLMLMLVVLLTVFIHNVKNRAEEELHLKDSTNQQLVLKKPIFASLIIIIGIFQFLFPSPPFIFYFMIWMTAGISLAILFKNFLSNYWLLFWLIVLLILFLSNSINLLLIFTEFERLAMVVLSLVGVFYGGFLFINDKKADLKERRILYFVGLMVLMQSLSLLFNLFGNLNLAKSFLVSGFLSVFLGVILLWTVRLINQLLALASHNYNRPDKKLFFINFDKVGEKVPSFFYFFLVIGWLVLIGKNFYAYTLISGGFNNFLNARRTLGDYDFSINTLFIFLIILIISVLLSRIISFFALDPDETTIPGKRKSIALGSWLLLVQIFVISMGLFLAIAASGIPLEKITIVLGALGVGIGLGLQGLFNNLVSGIILAFENPVKVGDLIELNGEPGVMKSIGFRSSVVNMFGGASIVIPNGELLSQQLVNWTMGKGKKVTIMVGVEYGTNLKNTSDLINEILKNDSRILNQPIPRVLPLEFSDSSIDIEIMFWVRHYLEVPFVKGDIINQIDVLFKKQGILIPFPQRDIHYKSSFKDGKSKNKD